MKITPILLLILMAVMSCTSNQSGYDPNSPLHAYFSTAPVVSKNASINVSLINGAVFSAKSSPGDFSINPHVKGAWVKVGEDAYVFSPETSLKSGTQYTIEIKTQGIENIPKEYPTHYLQFEVLSQDVELVTSPLRTDLEHAEPAFFLEGKVFTADASALQEIEQAVSFSSGQKASWTAVSPTEYFFIVKGIPRKVSASIFSVQVNGKPLGIDKKSSLDIHIPGLQDFEVMQVQTTSGSSPIVSVFFSDPVAPNQELAGLLKLEGEENLRLVTDQNEIRIIPQGRILGSRMLSVLPGIKNSFGYTLAVKHEQLVAFENPSPEIKLIGKGTLLPSGKGLYLPFEAVGLKSVQVRVIRIPEQNLPLFLQTNEFDGDYQMVRSGKLVFSGQVELKKDQVSLDNWNRHHLDLSTLFEAEKGALYRVELSMRPWDALSDCFEDDAIRQEQEGVGKDWSIYKNDGFSAWGNYSSWYYPEGYNWEERDNPCDVSYYNYTRTVATNLLATDIGLMAKIGSDNILTVITTSLSTAAPIAAQVEVLDFQLQRITLGKSNKDGFLKLEADRRPFLVIAQADGQKSYLKLNDGLALSTSNFDVSGQQITKGLKGMIYGERDVWRPGDAIFLSLLLEDKMKTLPDNYPISFELRDPSGKLRDEQVKTNGLSGLYTFQTQTAADDPTGNWLATVTAGNSKFTKRIKIETIKPNRLKIKLDFEKDTYLSSDGPINGTLTANWLTGLSAPQLQTQINVEYRSVPLQFTGFPGFSFGMSGVSFEAEPVTVVDQKTDQEGSLSFQLKVPVTLRPPGKLRMRLDTKVFEPGGGFSITSRSLDYIPYKTLVGVKTPEGDEYGYLNRESKHTFQLAALTDKGSPNTTQVQVEVFKMGWRWWWDQQYDSEASYISSGEMSPLFNTTVNIKEGKGQLLLNGKDLDWGRHMVVVTDPSSGHKAGAIFYMGWTEGEKSGLGSTFLSMTSNKDSYKTNEKIEVTLPNAIEGRALVTIENGSSILDQFWVSTGKGPTRFSFAASPEMAPNIYLNVTLIQAHGNTSNDLPIRSYGILPLQIYNPETVLEPQIQMANSLTPGKEVKITVSEKKGRAMSYTVALVDEGLLDITNFKTPNPWNHFYQREALGVKTWDLYDHVLGAYGGKLERLLAIGGSDLLNAEAGNKRDNRFEPVVKFLGAFELGAGKQKSHTFTMPQYIGSAKVMVVAGKDGNYGHAEKAVPVTQPLMVLGTLPRMIGPGETISLPVNILRMDAGIKQAAVSVKSSGVLAVDGASKKNFNLSSDTHTGYFTLMAGNEPGKGQVQMTATSGNETASHIINIESRLPNPPVSQVITRRLAKGEVYEGELVPIGLNGTNSASISIGRFPDIRFEKHLDYLIQYPHGCLEQVTSSAFPQLFLEQLTTLPLERKVAREQYVKAAIQKIRNFQTAEGSFSYWPGNGDISQWAGIYATHFLVEAKNKGFAVPNEMLQKALAYHKKLASNWKKSNTGYNEDMVQGYRLYLLVKAGEADQSAMNRMRNESGLSGEAVERLATAYALMGRKDVANTLLKAKPAVKSYDYWYTYGSEERDMAMRLETYTALGEFQKAFELLQSMADRIQKSGSLNTHAAAYTLMAISQFAAQQPAAKTLSAKITINGKESTWKTDLAIQTNHLENGNQKNKISILNSSDGDLYLNLTQIGVPAPGQEKAEANVLELEVKYTDWSGNPVILDNLPLGTQIKAHIKVRNTGATHIREIALTHLIPSGLEISNERVGELVNDYSDFRDIRDDRIYSYFDLGPGKTYSTTVGLTAAYAGRFYLPSISAEAMYQIAKYARNKGQWITISSLKP